MAGLDGVGGVAAPGEVSNVDPAHENVATQREQVCASGNASRIPTSRKHPCRRATTEDDVLILKETAVVQPQFKERGHRAAAWEAVASRVNEKLGTNDFTGHLCKRHYDQLLAKTALSNAIPQRGMPSIDDKLFTLVLEAIQREQQHRQEVAATNARQQKEFDDNILRKQPQQTTRAANETDVTSLLHEDVLQQQTSRAESGDGAHVDLPQETSIESIVTDVVDAQIRVLEANVSSQLSQLCQFFQEELLRVQEEQRCARERQQCIQEEAARMTSVLQIEVAALRGEFADCTIGQAKHIENLIFQSQAQHSELTRLHTELKVERTRREELEEEIVQLKNAAILREELVRRASDEVAVLVEITRQHVEILERRERVSRMSP